MFAKICAAVLILLSSIIGVFSPINDVEPMKIDADPDFVPVLRFVASSDSHVKKYGDIGTERIMKMIETGYAAAESDANYKKLDAAVLIGDTTNTGFPHTFASIYKGVKKVLRDETDFLAVAAKNHDSYLGRISRSYISAISGDKADFHKVINGFHFIGISASANIAVHYSDKQIEWLDKELAAAAAADPEKPIFVFQHEHIKDTVYGSLAQDGWGDEYFTAILSKYPQVVDISGHSHYPANDPRAIWQGSFTALNDGGLAYYEFTIDGARSQHPEIGDTMAQMLLVEVDAQNRVKVRVCDMTANAVTEEFLIDNITETNKTKYSFEKRRSEASAPVFDNEPEITVSENNIALNIKPAKVNDDDVVFIYRAEIKDESGSTVASGKKLGDYYKNPVCGDIKINMTVPGSGKYTVSIIAEDAWGLQSEPYTANITV